MASVRRYSGLDDLEGGALSSVVTMGVFDGVHIGHRELIRAAVNEARRCDLESTVVTFDPNPAEVIGKGLPPRRLSTLRHRMDLMDHLGVGSCVVLRFDRELSAVTPEDFVTGVLIERLGVARVVVGENFRFGHLARGDIDLLRRMGAELGFEVTGRHLVAMTPDGEPVSSTVIREQVAAGDVAAATRCLARPHRVEGTVVPGAGRGRGLGFPTANLEPTRLAAIPADGVYAGRLIVGPYGDEGSTHAAAVSIGTNPTFDGKNRQIEAFAYDEIELDVYSREVAIDFVARLRGQEAFATEKDLVEAMERDVGEARKVIGE